MHRYAAAVAVAVGLCACGAPGDDEGTDGLNGASTATAQGKGGDHDTPSSDDKSDDNDDPPAGGDQDGTGQNAADCDPEPIPMPPLTCPSLDPQQCWDPWCDGDCIKVKGDHFAWPGQAALVVRFTGTYTGAECGGVSVDVRFRANYISAKEATFDYEAGDAPRGFGADGGTFTGCMIIVNVERDGREWTSEPIEVSIEFVGHPAS